MDCLCRGCEKRKVGCHANCKDYKDYRSELDKIKQSKKRTITSHI